MSISENIINIYVKRNTIIKQIKSMNSLVSFWMGVILVSTAKIQNINENKIYVSIFKLNLNL